MPVRKPPCWWWWWIVSFWWERNEVCVIEDAHWWWHQEDKLCTSKISSLVEKLCPTVMLVRILLCWWWWIVSLWWQILIVVDQRLCSDMSCQIRNDYSVDPWWSMDSCPFWHANWVRETWIIEDTYWWWHQKEKLLHLEDLCLSRGNSVRLYMLVRKLLLLTWNS